MRDVHYQERRLEALPDLIGMHARNPERYPFLLETAARGVVSGSSSPELDSQSRYSLLFAFPGESIELSSDQLGHAGSRFFDQLDERWQQERVPELKSRLPFTGGWFLYLSYELAGAVEPGLRLPADPDAPVAWAVRVPAAIVIDHARSEAWAVAETEQASLLDPLLEDATRSTEGRQEEVTDLLEGALTEEDPEHYREMVRRTRRYIHEGDVFQANLSRSWQGSLREGIRPVDVYRRLRQSNPGPFAGLAVRGEQAIISSSPERLVSCRGQRVETRPIAGTRPRGRAGKDDEALREELMAHPKERAEHIMLIDLERNDLGRICRPGSVEVSELMVMESYAHVHHIVSNVRGELRDGITPGAVLRAVFPGGTITGCPKVRCMEIIAELEDRPRGAYTGSLAYLNRDGSMDSSILIRTMETRGRALRLLAGAGIVADSDPDRELEETRAKARGMLLALEPEA